MNVKKHLLKTALFILSVVFVSLAVILFIPSLSPAKPTITWTPVSIEETVSPSESKEISASFTSIEDITNIVVRIAPELEAFIQVEPSSFSQITKGETVNINLTISAEQDSPLGTFNGTIQFKNGNSMNSNTFSKPLPVVVNVGQLFQDEEYGFQIRYDPVFEINELQSYRPEFIKGNLFVIPGDMPNLSIILYENPSALSVYDWYLTTLADKEYTYSDASSRSIIYITVGGIQSLQVSSNLLGYVKLRTFIPYGDKVYELETSIPDDAKIPESYFLMLETFSFL